MPCLPSVSTALGFGLRNEAPRQSRMRGPPGRVDTATMPRCDEQSRPMRMTWPAYTSGPGSGHTRAYRPGLPRQPEPEAWATRYTFGRMGFQLPSTQVAVDGSTVCGLATTGLCRDDDLSNFGELMAIYVDPAYLRTGVGRLLMTAARSGCAASASSAAALWVLDGNARARRFYERDGWRCDGTHRTSTYGDVPSTKCAIDARSTVLAQGEPGQAGRPGKRRSRWRTE